MCGCGQTTTRSNKTDRAHGLVKGQYTKYIAGHNARTAASKKLREAGGVNPDGWCSCGCGNLAPIAPVTCVKNGYIKGQRMRYIRGHANRKHHLIPEYVEKDCGYTSPCWIWQRGSNGKGYGVVYTAQRAILAHRVVYEKERGTISPGLVIDHLCEKTMCVNPDHLEPVSSEENSRRFQLGLRNKVIILEKELENKKRHIEKLEALLYARGVFEGIEPEE